MAAGVVDWERFSEWIHCFCIVTFDLEVGQAIERIYPPHAALSERERTNVCYLAFPDSNSGCMGDTEYHVRLRTAPDPATTTNGHSSADTQNANKSESHHEAGHFTGFVYFRQRRAPDLPRGYFQKSFVLLTRLPFLGLFSRICHHVASLYFDDGDSVLDAAAGGVGAWPRVAAGSVVLPLLGQVFSTVIAEGGGSENEVEGCEKIVASLNEPDALDGLLMLVPHLQLLWELVLTGEPLVVIASSPTDCSDMVNCLSCMIHPLVYSGETRPYFTIHDSEFREFTQCSSGPPSVILGVTNPFFGKTLKDWPHTLRLTDTTALPLMGTIPRVKAKSSPDGAAGIYSHYKTFLHQEKSVERHILGRSGRPRSVQSALLRRYLLELTQSFLIPLERYITKLMPLMRQVSPFGAPPAPQHFNQEDFVQCLRQAGPQLTTSLRGDWEGLYRRFFRSQNFRQWYEHRHKQLTLALHKLHLQVLARVDLDAWMEGKHEVEVVDMVLKLRQKIAVCDKTSSKTNETRLQLEKQLQDIEKRLPEDLRLLLSTNAATAAANTSPDSTSGLCL